MIEFGKNVFKPESDKKPKLLNEKNRFWIFKVTKLCLTFWLQKKTNRLQITNFNEIEGIIKANYSLKLGGLHGTEVALALLITQRPWVRVPAWLPRFFSTA